MRTILNPLIPNPTFLRQLFRLVLGAFAGTSTSWLFGNAARGVFDASASPVTIFGLAFLLVSSAFLKPKAT